MGSYIHRKKTVSTLTIYPIEMQNRTFQNTPVIEQIDSIQTENSIQNIVESEDKYKFVSVSVEET